MGPAGRLSLLTEPSALTVQRPGYPTAAADGFQLSADRHVGAGQQGLTPLGLLAPAVGKISTVGRQVFNCGTHTSCFGLQNISK